MVLLYLQTPLCTIPSRKDCGVLLLGWQFACLLRILEIVPETKINNINNKLTRRYILKRRPLFCVILLLFLFVVVISFILVLKTILFHFNCERLFSPSSCLYELFANFKENAYALVSNCELTGHSISP